MTHDDFHNHTNAYLAGGLSDAERASFEGHAAGCPACAAALEQAEAADRELDDLFAAARPDGAFEDRLVARLRAVRRPPMVLHPMVRRAAVGVAAAILLGGAGFAVTQAEQGELPLLSFLDRSPTSAPETMVLGDVSGDVRRVKGASNLRQMGEAVATKSPGIVSPAEMAWRFAESTAGPARAPASAATEQRWFRSSGAANPPPMTNLWGDSASAAGGRGKSDKLAVEHPAKPESRAASETPGGGSAMPAVKANRGLALGISDAESAWQKNAPVDEMDMALVPTDDREVVKLHAGAVPNLQKENGATPKQVSGRPAVAFGDGHVSDAPANVGDQVVRGKSDGVTGYYAVDADPRAVVAGKTVTEGGAASEGKFLPAELYAHKERAASDHLSDQTSSTWGVDGKAMAAGRPDAISKGKDFGTVTGLAAAQGIPAGGESAAADSREKLTRSLGDQDAKAEAQVGLGDGTVQKPGKALKDGVALKQIAAGQEVAESAQPVTEAPKRSESASPDEKPDDYSDSPNLSLEEDKDGGGAGGRLLGRADDAFVQAESRAGDGGKPADAGNADAAPAAPDASAPAQQDRAEQQRKQELARQGARKIIRNGEMSFEVDGYDSAVVQITKIADEEAGFVATTESQKLPNGKVKGSVIVRVPPERLDTLVLKLRGLGDLKSSRVAAQDITKQFTDLESQLRAAKTMEERLLEIIKSGKGEVKDLLEAEKQLGTWRERIETLQGEINYFGNLVSLSTLTVTLTERDIRTSGLLSESEQVNMGVEADDVEVARTAALKAIDEVKGRIVESDLKTHDAGQYSATIVADVSPDSAGQVIDRLKQIGRVSRLEVQRRRETAEGTAPAPGARIERKDTRLQLSIYNLANVAPRNTTTLNLAAEDVEKAYRAILEQITSAGGRVVNSQLTKPTPEQTTGTITFEAPIEGADVLLGAVRGAGEVMRLDSTTNPDTQNSTDAKRGFSVQIQSLATVPPRESTTLRVAARDVPAAFATLRDTVRGAGGRILTSQLTEQDRTNVTGQLDFEVRREDVAAVDTALATAGVVLSRNVTRSADAQNTVDSKVMLQVALVDERTVPPRETVTLSLAVDDVPTKYEALLEALRGDAIGAGGARVLVSTINQQDPNNTTAQIEFDVRRTDRAAIDKALAEAGAVYGRTVSRPAESQAALDDKVRLAVTLNDLDNLAPRETTTLGLEAADVSGVARAVEATAISLGGRKVDSDWAQDPGGREIARVVVDVPLAKSLDLLGAARREGRVLTIQNEQNPAAPEGSFARARLALTVATEDRIVQRDQGLGASIKSGLATSVHWLLQSVTWIVIGLCLIAPWALIVWVGYRIARNRKRGRATTSASPPPASGPPAGGPVVLPSA